MTIATLEQYEASFRRTVRLFSGQWPSNMAPLVWGTQATIQDDPGAIGTLAVTSSGAVPVAGDQGFPDLGDSGGAQCYLSRVRVNQTAATSGGSDYGRLFLYDRLFHAGEFSTSSTTTFTLTSQPSYASRLPGGSYVGTQIWIEVTASAGASVTLAITYTNQSGTAGRTTGAVAYSWGARYMFQARLQAGDTGVQKIESIQITSGGSGNINIVVARPLWFGVVPFTRPGHYYSEFESPMEALSFLPVYETSALCTAFSAAIGSTTNPEIELFVEIAS